MAAVMVESGWDYFTCVLTLRLKKTWSSWAKALRSWARVLWLGEALGGTGKSEGIFQTWLRKAKAKSLVRLGLVHLCAVMLRSNCLRCGYTSWGIRLWKLGPGSELSGSVEFSFPSYFSWSQRCWKHFHQLWCSSIHDIHDTRPCENEGIPHERVTYFWKSLKPLLPLIWQSSSSISCYVCHLSPLPNENSAQGDKDLHQHWDW